MIDLSYLNDITDGDMEAKNQIISLFFSQASEIMQRFEAARLAGDVEEIGQIAHLAKSTSRVMGITNVSDKMEELQHIVDRHEQPERYNELVDFYIKEIPAALDELRNAISTSQPES